MERKNYCIKRKYNLFYDYSNSYNVENIKENKIISKNKSILSNYYYYPNNYRKINNINNHLNSSSLNKSIKQRKESFNRICSSINDILNRYKSDKINDYKNKEFIMENLSLNLEIKNQKVNRIAEHLIKAYSKEELRLIRQKINTKIEEDEEPKPEIFLPKYFPKKQKKEINLNKSNIISKDFFKKINKNKTSYKPIKLEVTNISKNRTKNNLKNNKSNRKDKNQKILRRNIDNNFQLNPTFLTYIKCKTSFECLDNFLKKLKKTKENIKRRKINIMNKTFNKSSKTSYKYLNKTMKLNKKEKVDFTPKKYINHKYDYIKSSYKNDEHLLERIKEQRKKQINKYKKIKEEENNELLFQCTFKPDISKTTNSNNIYQGRKKLKLTKVNINTENDSKNSSYVDFYQYKMNQKRRNKTEKEKIKKNERLLNIKQSPKKIKEIKSDKKVRNINNKQFLEFHQLIIQKSFE